MILQRQCLRHSSKTGSEVFKQRTVEGKSERFVLYGPCCDSIEMAIALFEGRGVAPDKLFSGVFVRARARACVITLHDFNIFFQQQLQVQNLMAQTGNTAASGHPPLSAHAAIAHAFGVNGLVVPPGVPSHTAGSLTPAGIPPISVGTANPNLLGLPHASGIFPPHPLAPHMLGMRGVGPGNVSSSVPSNSSKDVKRTLERSSSGN